jgi:hypothetical protein
MLTMSGGLNLREVADALDIPSWRLSRLGRYLGIDPSEKCIPREEVQRIADQELVEQRYSSIRHWLLVRVRSRRTGLR